MTTPAPLPDTTSLPVDADALYPDTGDPSRKLHQQHHDLVHAAVKLLPTWVQHLVTRVSAVEPLAAAALPKPATPGTAGQTLVLDTDAVTPKWATASGPAGATTGVRAGLYYPSPRRALTTTALPLNELRVVPFRLEKNSSFDRIAIEVTTAAAGASVRLGIYADDGRGYPGAVAFDAGTVAADTVGIKALIITHAPPAGVYWIGAVAQGAGCSVRSYVEGDIPAAGLVAFDTIGNAPFSVPSCYTQAGVSGALPATFSTTTAPAGSNAAPYVGLRAA